MSESLSRRKAVKAIGASVITGAAMFASATQAKASQLAASSNRRGTARCAVAVRVIVEGLVPTQPGEPGPTYQWLIAAGDTTIWRSDRNSALVPNEYGVATAIADISMRQFLRSFDPNTTVGYLLAHPNEPAARYWEVKIFDAGPNTRVLIEWDVDMGVGGHP